MNVSNIANINLNEEVFEKERWAQICPINIKTLNSYIETGVQHTWRLQNEFAIDNLHWRNILKWNKSIIKVDKQGFYL
jgi:hypothetical protein